MNIRDQIDHELHNLTVDERLARKIRQSAAGGLKRAKPRGWQLAFAGAALAACAVLALALWNPRGATLTPLTDNDDDPALLYVEVTPDPEPDETPLPEPDETPVPEPIDDGVTLAYDRIPANPELPTAHRPGFAPAQITFLGGLDGSAQYRDINGKRPGATNYDVAQYGLRELYNITGYLVEKCYVEPHDYENPDGWLNYSFSGAPFVDGEYNGDGWFLRYAVDSERFASAGNYNMIVIGYSAGTMLGKIGGRTTVEALKAGEVPLIPMDNIAHPANIDNMNYEEVAQWYYENSTFGGRERVVRTEVADTPGGWGGGSINFTIVKLYLGN
ncbi:MAG: hypothetical protein FWE69_00385, partial [Clostridiales bacterium]|nr:hypothetical protein [Clostridiales bacterium]